MTLRARTRPFAASAQTGRAESPSSAEEDPGMIEASDIGGNRRVRRLGAGVALAAALAACGDGAHEWQASAPYPQALAPTIEGDLVIHASPAETLRTAARY